MGSFKNFFIGCFVWVRTNAIWLWPVVVASGVLIYAAVEVRPFAAIASGDAIDDVGSSWNTSISKLGISPLFPPQEDFYVGDVWATVVSSEGYSLTGKSIRLGHIPINSFEESVESDEPVFPDTETKKSDSDFRHTNTEQVAHPSDVSSAHTSFVAFPDANIAKRTKSNANLNIIDKVIGSSSNLEVNEVIKIPTAETYGIPSINAIPKLVEWCSSEKFKLLCTDRYIHNAMAYSLGSELKDMNADGTYKTKMSIYLITRVYLAREIEQEYELNGGKNFALGNDQKQSDGDANKDKVVSVIVDERGVKTGVSLKEVFQRPLVFGFRSVSINPLK
jgi:hypothetical protein